MTLKDKFLELLKDYNPAFKNTESKGCEQIADDFAIGFAEWCDDNYFRMGNTSFWSESMDWDNKTILTTHQLLEIYKK